MKVAVLSVRILACLVCISIIASSMRRMRASVCSVRHVLIEHDALLSKQAKSEIVDAINCMQREDGTYNPVTLVQQLPEKFSFIASVTIQSLAYNTAHIFIEAREPLVNMNENLVLTHDGIVISSEQYDADACLRMPRVTISPSLVADAMPQELVSSITTYLKNGLAQQYDLVLVSDHELLLRDKNEPRFSIICDAAAIPNHDMIARCEHIKQKCIADAVTSQGKGKALKHWKADIRFHDQIIVSRDHSRGEYGTYV